MEQKFCIGDKVKVVKAYIEEKEKFIGREFKVDGSDAGGKYPYSLEGEDLWYWSDDELKLVSPSRYTGELKEGMRVHVVENEKGTTFWRGAEKDGIILKGEERYRGSKGLWVDLEGREWSELSRNSDGSWSYWY